MKRRKRFSFTDSWETEVQSEWRIHATRELIARIHLEEWMESQP